MKPVISELRRCGAGAIVALASLSCIVSNDSFASYDAAKVSKPAESRITRRVDAVRVSNYSSTLMESLLSPASIGSLRLSMRTPFNAGAPDASELAEIIDPDGTRSILLQRGTANDSCRVVYRSDFDSPFQDTLRSEWSYGDVRETPDGRRFLGTIGNGSTTLTVNHAPKDGSYVIQFDILAIGDWKGNSTSVPQVWGLRVVDGPTLIETNFATVPGTTQAYPDTVGRSDFEPGFQAVEKFTTSDGKMGSVYRLTYRFERTAAATASGSDDVRIEFYSRGLDTGAGAPVWGLSNVVLGLVPGSGAGGGGGGIMQYAGDWNTPAFAMSGYGIQPAGGGGSGGGGGSDVSEEPPTQAEPSDPTPSDPTPTPPEWNQPPVVQIPAPSTALLLGLGGLAVGRRKR